ncbi:hypothetical protein [Neobacillus dielmonensis]|uniref:hypothetical protein n=1 Tax=Neobacillus dielmonensis TaxID=1347369 RepID=UPI0005AB2448|nr:hypothetical protein [Neobacillus dielmonensis]
MKKEIALAFTAFFLISLTAITGVYAFEENSKTVEIAKEEADITGDGQNEDITLKGVPYEEAEEGYLSEIYADINASNGKSYTIHLESGSKAAMELVDLNNDGLKDLFINIFTGGSDGTTIDHLYTLKDFKKTDLSVPAPLDMESRFLNGYKAEIKIAETGYTYHFDLKDRKKYYKKLGLYYKGKLNEPIELTVNSYSSLNPAKLEDGRYGLKGVQRVTGIANADLIAQAESTWTFINGSWRLAHVKVLKQGQ